MSHQKAMILIESFNAILEEYFLNIKLYVTYCSKSTKAQNIVLKILMPKLIHTPSFLSLKRFSFVSKILLEE